MAIDDHGNPPDSLTPTGLITQASLPKHVFVPRAKQWVDAHGEPDYLDLLGEIQRKEETRMDRGARENLQELLKLLAHRAVPLGREIAFQLASRSPDMSFLVWTNPGLTPAGEGRLWKHIRKQTQFNVQEMLEDSILVGAVRAGEELPVEVMAVLEKTIKSNETWWAEAADLAIEHIHTSNQILSLIAEKNRYTGRRIVPLLGHPNLTDQTAAQVVRHALRNNQHPDLLIQVAVEGRQGYDNQQVRETIRQEANNIENLQWLIRTGSKHGDLLETIRAMKEKFPEQEPGLGLKHIWGALSELPEAVIDELADHNLENVRQEIENFRG